MILKESESSGAEPFRRFASALEFGSATHPAVKIGSLFTRLTSGLDKDPAVFFDDFDRLEPGPLAVFLSRIGKGFNTRHAWSLSKFPRSTAFSGPRDMSDHVRDREDPTGEKGAPGPRSSPSTSRSGP